MESLQAPERFGIVEPQVYRSSVFHPVNFSFVSALKLRTIVHLSPEVPLRAVSNYMEENDIRLLPLGNRFWRAAAGWAPMSLDLVKEALEAVLDERNHPVMLMCTSGIHQTGTVVGCLRRIQRRTYASIIDELRAFGFPSHTRYANEAFIEVFDTDLVSVPTHPPKWILRSGERPGLPSLNALDPAYKRFYGKHEGPLTDKLLKHVDGESEEGKQLAKELEAVQRILGSENEVVASNQVIVFDFQKIQKLLRS